MSLVFALTLIDALLLLFGFTGNQDAFYSGLPTLVVNPNPQNFSQAVANMERLCTCPRYCWDDPAAAMFKNTPWIAKIVMKCIDAYLASLKPSQVPLLPPLFPSYALFSS